MVGTEDTTPQVSTSHFAFDSQATIAYFCMEIALEPGMPTYSGGLGVLAGDTLRAAADLGLPIIGVTLLYRNGYFRQHLDEAGNQTESPVQWLPEQFLEPLNAKASVAIEGRRVFVKAWRYVIRGESGHGVTVYFLDTDLPENEDWDRTLTDNLYGGDAHYRFCQEAILGLGGIAILSSLGHERIQTYHMNEGHSALLVLGLLEKQMSGRGLGAATVADKETVRSRCVFTTHTPVSAGHDRFSLDLVSQVLGEEIANAIISMDGAADDLLNMTLLALSFSHHINGVAMRHRQVSRQLFPRYDIDAITNGVHAFTWTSLPFIRLFDRHIPQWRRDNFHLRYAMSIPPEEVRAAHREAKREFFAQVRQRNGVDFDLDVFTIGFARRAAIYKRPALLFSDIERLQKIVSSVGPLQVVYGGKAHPHDEAAKEQIRKVFEAADALQDSVRVIYIEDYDIALARYFCSGVDLWLNTPEKPYEASGTSGMKAALNGVPSLSVLDGWWLEGHIEGVTGWAIGTDAPDEDNVEDELESMYGKLEKVILPLFYKQPDRFAEVMRSTAAYNGSFFNTQRMLIQYMRNIYRLDHQP